MGKKFIAGVDLGKLSDFTAISVIEEGFLERPNPTIRDLEVGHKGSVSLERRWTCRHLDRAPVGTPYDQIVAGIKGMVDSPELKDNVELVVDATGVGRPVIDMMRHEGLKPIPITITGGSSIHLDEDGGYHVPKYDLVAALQSWWAMHRLLISSKLPLQPVLLKELQNFVPKITKANNVTYEALREGDHDDLVLSLALAVWWGSYTRSWDYKYNRLEPEEKPYNPRSYLTGEE